jgi:predicted XRE-type DNA-binding protein
MRNKKRKNYIIAKGPLEIAHALGITSPVDIALLEYKARLSKIAVETIIQSGLSINEIVERSGISRSKVSAINNGALAGISIDLFLKVISAVGRKVVIKLAS